MLRHLYSDTLDSDTIDIDTVDIDTLTLTLNFGSSSDHISQSSHDDTFSSSEKTGNYLIIVSTILILKIMKMDKTEKKSSVFLVKMYCEGKM